jgi:hypothetical protein
MIVSLTGLHDIRHHCFSVVVLLKALGRDLYRMVKHQDSSKSLSIVNSNVLEFGFLTVDELNVLVYL